MRAVTLILILTLAAAPAAQQTDRARLQRAVALEQAEHDPVAALAEYRALAREASDRGVRGDAALRALRLLRAAGDDAGAQAVLDTALAAGGDVAARARALAAQDPERSDEQERIRTLLASLRDRRAVDDLVWIGRPALAPLLDYARGASGTGLRNAAAALVRIGGTPVDDWLREVAAANDAKQQETVLKGYGNVKNVAPGVAGAMQGFLAAADDNVRAGAVGLFGPDLAPERLVELLDDPASVVREFAFRQLEQRWPALEYQQRDAEVQGLLLPALQKLLPSVDAKLGGRIFQFVQRPSFLAHRAGRDLFLLAIAHPAFESAGKSSMSFAAMTGALAADEHATEVGQALAVLGPMGAGGRLAAQSMLAQFAAACAPAWSAASLPTMRAVIAAGYDQGGVSLRAAEVSVLPDDAVALVETWAAGRSPLTKACWALAKRPVPEAALPALRRWIEQSTGDEAMLAGPLRLVASTEGDAARQLFVATATNASRFGVAVRALNPPSAPSARLIAPLLALPVDGDVAAARGRAFWLAMASEEDVAVACAQAYRLGVDYSWPHVRLAERRFHEVALACVDAAPERAWPQLVGPLGIAVKKLSAAALAPWLAHVATIPTELPEHLVSSAGGLVKELLQRPDVPGHGGLVLRCLADPRWRAQVDLDDLAVLRLPGVAAALRGLLADPEPRFVRAVVGGLGLLGHVEDVARLEPLQRHEDEWVRLDAFRALVRIAPVDAPRFVAMASADQEPRVRLAVCSFAERDLRPELVPPLLRLLRDPVKEVRMAAADALAAVEFYRTQTARWQRLQEVGELDATSAAAALVAQARKGESDRRVLAIESLGTLGVAETLPFLLELLDDQDTTVAAAARAAIAKINASGR